MYRGRWIQVPVQVSQNSQSNTKICAGSDAVGQVSKRHPTRQYSHGSAHRYK